MGLRAKSLSAQGSDQMRYILVAIFVCAVGMPEASALPTVSPNSVSVSKDDPIVQVVKRYRPHAHRHSRTATASILWSEAVNTKKRRHRALIAVRAFSSDTVAAKTE